VLGAVLDVIVARHLALTGLWLLECSLPGVKCGVSREVPKLLLFLKTAEDTGLLQSRHLLQKKIKLTRSRPVPGWGVQGLVRMLFMLNFRSEQRSDVPQIHLSPAVNRWNAFRDIIPSSSAR
jgi:hypothetical protein